MHVRPDGETRRHPLAAGIYLILLAILSLAIILSVVGNAFGAKPIPAGGGRIHAPCPTSRTLSKRVTCLVKAVRWQQANVRRANLELARVRVATPLMDTTYICKLGEVIYHVRTSHCTRVVGCESGGNPHLDEYAGDNGAAGASQYQPRTWAGTVFARAGFSLFDPVAAILSMDAYAAAHGFNTGGGWAASHACHGLSGPES